EEFLKDIGESFLINDLRLLQDVSAVIDEEYANFPLITDINGTTIGRLIWTPPTPGYDVLRSVLLPMGIVLGLFCIVGLATVFRARRLAGALAQSNEDLEASQKEIAQQLNVVAGEKEKIESIVSSIGEGLIAVDPEGKIFLCNSVGALLLGKKRTEIIGSSLEKVFRLDKNKSPELSSVFGILHTKKTVDVPEVEFIREDGENMTLALTATPVESAGSFIGGIVVFNDVTEQKMVENAKRNFITTAAHQLRTPLSGVKWAMSVLVDGKSKSTPQEKKTLLTKSYESVNRVISLVNDLLNVDKIESQQIQYSFAPTDLVEIVRSPLTDLQAQMEQKKLKVKFEATKNIPNLTIDSANMRVVFQNLLENSLHYTLPKGSVTVEITTEGKEVRISIADTGIGIPRGEQKSIFLRFFRASNAIAVQPNGSGLGLYICKQIVEKHKGKIWFESEQNKGTTFHVVLPIEEGTAKNLKKDKKKNA
ncbi:PAS domain S-box protein, partial [Candidatus Parcubacteria bacterium]